MPNNMPRPTGHGTKAAVSGGRWSRNLERNKTEYLDRLRCLHQKFGKPHYLCNLTHPDYTKSLLPNGITLVHKYIKATRLVHCGYVIDCGSRHDFPQQGMAHAIEHMVFKGTQRRKNWQIISYLENVGGELNAYTTRDYTAIYTSLHKKYASRALDLLTDIVFHSSIPAQELEKEKKVILEEINMYLDSPEESIADEFQEQFFGKHSLAHNILGTPEDVKAISQQGMLDFYKHQYTTNNSVLAIVGNITLQKATLLACALPVPMAEKAPKTKAQKFKPNTQRVVKELPIHQAHIMMGCVAPSLTSPQRWTLLLLNNILGGPALNSRLSLAIREKHGLAYHIESSYQMYMDCGFFNIYVGCDTENVEKCESLVMQELKKLATKPMGAMQLTKAKNQLMGQAVIAEESYSSVMLHLGKSILRKGKALSFDEAMQRIQAITAEDIQNLAKEIFKPEAFGILIYKAKK